MTDDRGDGEECEFSAADLTFSDDLIEEFGSTEAVSKSLGLASWGCSRQVWEEADDNRCVWHAAKADKPPDELAARIDGGDLPGASVPGTELASITFPADDAIKLTAADLTDANLRFADLSEAVLGYSDLSEANLSGADLPGTSLRDADLSEANLRNVDLSGALLRNVDLSEALLRNADLSRADLRDADLTEIRYPDQALEGSILAGANLEGADLTEMNLSKADLAGTQLNNATVDRASLNKAEFSTVDIRQTLLPDWALFGTDLNAAELTDAGLSDLRTAPVADAFTITGLDPGGLRGATLTRTELKNAELTGVTAQEAMLNGANAEGADFTDADLSEAALINVDAENATFSNAVLVRASLETADLIGADLHGAHLFGTRLEGARVSSTTQLSEEGLIGEVAVNDRCRYDTEALPDGPVESLALTEHDLAERADSPRAIQFQRGRDAYRRLEKLARNNGLLTLQGEMFKRRQEMRRRLLKEQDERVKRWFAEVQRWLFVYGESFSRILAVSTLVVGVFWLLFLFTGTVETEAGETVTPGLVEENPTVVWEILYHSLSVFFAGDGPLTPVETGGQVLTVLLRATGPILVALLIFVLGRRASR